MTESKREQTPSPAKQIQKQIAEKAPIVRRYKVLYVEQLEFFKIRDIRAGTVEKIIKNIKEEGFYDAKVLTVIPHHKDTEKYIVVDGNHRLKALKEIGKKRVPCVIMENADPYKLAIRGNKAEDVYAPMDLFDWLDIIEQLKSKGLTQQEIGDRIGWSRSMVSRYQQILEKIVTQVLDFSKKHQKGRVPSNVTNVTFDFTEGWFRSSGLYDLSEEHQLKIIQWFFENNIHKKRTNKLLIKKTNQLKEIENQIELMNSTLNPSVDNTRLLDAIKKGEYTTNRLKDVIKTLNEGAKNQAQFGVDCRRGLKKIKENSIDCLITDPEWGVEYTPSRGTNNPEFDEGLERALTLLQETLAECSRVLKGNAHAYIFFPTMFYCEFKRVLEKFFKVYPIPIIWKKNNHNLCNFENRYASIYETIFFCKMPKGDMRTLNNEVSPDVLEFDKPTNKYHDCQKPIDLLEHFILNSTGENEFVLDPFMGSGSTLIAAAKNSRYYIGFELDETYEAKFKRRLGKIL